MTTRQLHLFNCMYLVILTGVAILTRATARRIAGAVAGGAGAGIVALGIIGVGESAAWWHFALPKDAYFLTLLEIDFALAGFVLLITWRIARRFGARGLSVTLVIAAVIGPLRDYWAATKAFPEWVTYGGGVAPVLAISGAYVLLGVVGHGLMRLIAGPATADRLARSDYSTSRGAV